MEFELNKTQKDIQKAVRDFTAPLIAAVKG